MNSAVIFGGYGTFGRLVARELVSRGLPVVIVGRDQLAAQETARRLGTTASWGTGDVNHLESCRALIKGHTVAITCAGPFHKLNSSLLDACLLERCHYVDIADDRNYVRTVRGRNREFRSWGLCAVVGSSSLPSISGSLAWRAQVDLGGSPRRARVTLFIGNDNPKGSAAIASLVRTFGQPIAAPQGTIHGWRDRTLVTLPSPFGNRSVYNFDSPDYDLMPEQLGVESMTVKVGFELGLANRLLSLFAALPAGFRPATARFLSVAGRARLRLGSSGGAVMVELWDERRAGRWAAIFARRDGQRMAALPCALAAQQLLTAQPVHLGAMTACEFLGCQTLLRELAAAGFELATGSSSSV